jgi:hypothetical protein
MSALGTHSTIMIKGHHLAFHCNGSGNAMLLVRGITSYRFIRRRLVHALRGLP